MAEPAPAAGYRADIDGLRAIAVLSVLGFHAFPGYVPGGFFGVDVFFVLSGYLITGLLLNDAARGGIDWRGFYARRIRRLFPAALLVVAVTCGAGVVLLFPHEYARLVRHGWASLFFVENILLAREVGYFDVAAAAKPLLHFWSLAVEEQFYLVWPIALGLVGRRRGAAGVVIVAVIVLSLALVLGGEAGSAWHFYSPFTRAWELGAGAGLAWHVRRRGPGGRWANVASVGALGVLAAMMLIGPRGQPAPGWVTLIPVGATVTLLATGPAAWASARVLSLRPAVWIGLISYPLYLWHWPLLSYAYIVLGERGSTVTRLALLAVAFVLAAATYRFVERPIRFAWPARRAIVTLAGGAIALAALIAVPLLVPPPAADRIAQVAADQLEGVAWRYTVNDLCRRTHPEHFTAFCMQSGTADPAVLFVGNSYANHLFPGLAQHPRLNGVSMLAFGTCEVSRNFPIGIYGPDQCDRQLAMLGEYSTIRLVVVASQWSLFDDAGRMTDLQPGDPGKVADYPDAKRYRRGLEATFAILARRGVPVVVFGPKPELGYDMADCYGRPLRPATRTCAMPRAVFEARSRVTAGILRGIVARHPNLRYFDMTDLFCDARTCRYIAPDGSPWLRDGNGHLSVIGSRHVADRFVAWADAHGVLDFRARGG
ncbi:MAG: acyltransferase family protein [Pseudomonadota bacterium]